MIRKQALVTITSMYLASIAASACGGKESGFHHNKSQALGSQIMNGFDAETRNSDLSCEMSAISGLWPDGQGGWIGSSRIEWLACSDGNNYTATCSHRGSGQTMDTCSCQINDDVYEQHCEQALSSEDLLKASQVCCGFFPDQETALFR